MSRENLEKRTRVETKGTFNYILLTQKEKEDILNIY